MRHRLILAASACALIVTALPAAAQNSNPQQSTPQYNYPVGRAANDAGPNYSGTSQNTPASGQRTGTAEQRAPNGAYAARRGENYYNFAGGPGMGAPEGGAIAWCQAHFRSFNPATGTFIGFDGVRHPCP
jgi:BA14K-like protein